MWNFKLTSLRLCIYEWHTDIELLLFCQSIFYQVLTFLVTFAENLVFLQILSSLRHSSSTDVCLSSAGWSNKERGSSSATTRYGGADVTLGEHVTPALESGYKYYYSISRCYSQAWNLTPAFTDDLASVSHHLHSHSKPLAWRVRGWCGGSDMSLTTFSSSSEGWPNGAACGQISNICSRTQWAVKGPPAPSSVHYHPSAEGQNAKLRI